ncbi:amidohydrolase family protein [Streptosporangium longisporum]
MNDVVIVNCTVTDARAARGSTAEGRVADAAVWVRGDRIAAAGPREEVTGLAGDARVIDLGGAHVTPGLVNMHTHLSLSLPGRAGDGVRDMTAHELALYMADGARRTLHCGVTTVRCVAEKDHADFALRRAIEAGRATGPRIFTAGRALVCTGGPRARGRRHPGVRRRRRVPPGGTRSDQGRRGPHQDHDLRGDRRGAREDRHPAAVLRRDGRRAADRARLGP